MHQRGRWAKLIAGGLHLLARVVAALDPPQERPTVGLKGVDVADTMALGIDVELVLR